jgi:uncharacterized protein YcbK (DUF882 family)
VKRFTVLAALGGAVSSSFSGRGAIEAPPPAPAPAVAPAPPAAPPRPAAAWAAELRALHVTAVRTHSEATVRLYRADGSFDEDAALAFDLVAAAATADALPPPMSRRLLRLVVKAAAHFHATEITLVSTFRDSARKGSRHRTGEAVDFIFPGVTAAKLAAHLRGYARVGVGVYTNSRTQFVHLDVRDQSYHWVDASPPGRVWRESPLTDRGALARDAAYRPEEDLPEIALARKPPGR